MYGELETARYIELGIRSTASELQASLLAPGDKPTGQSLTFIERTTRSRVITVFPRINAASFMNSADVRRLFEGGVYKSRYSLRA